MVYRGVIMTGGPIPAILAGVKTRTRRMPTAIWAKLHPGDRLWVRETWTHEHDTLEGARAAHEDAMEQSSVIYRASTTSKWAGTVRWKPSLHMPRWASRITLSVTSVRSELLQDITEDDAIAEGVMMWPDLSGDREGEVEGCARARFAELWDNLHGGGSWAANPVIRVISFERV